jgi:hypothetical protein
MLWRTRREPIPDKAVLALSIVLFMYTPGEGMEWPVLAGVIITLAIGEVVIRFSENHKKT